MQPITINHYLILSGLLFCLGLIGLVIRRNILVLLMCIEVLMYTINLAFLAIARYYNLMDGLVIAVFVMAIAAVEAAVGLGIVISLFRNRQTVDTLDFRTLKG